MRLFYIWTQTIIKVFDNHCCKRIDNGEHSSSGFETPFMKQSAGKKINKSNLQIHQENLMYSTYCEHSWFTNCYAMLVLEIFEFKMLREFQIEDNCFHKLNKDYLILLFESETLLYTCSSSNVSYTIICITLLF